MTPLTKIGQLYFKREDLNPTGSAKDRALPVQIENLLQQKYSTAVISSTGNAAISASYYCHQANIPLTVFVSPHINPKKLSLIKAHVIKSPRPISDSIKFSKSHKSYLLRQSTDPHAQTGYGQIATELLIQLPEITSLIIPVGSGTTLLGVAKKLPKNVKIFAAQSAANPTISSHFDSEYLPEEINITDSLTVKYLPLKKEIIAQIKQHHGSAATLSSLQINEQLNIVKQLKASIETALSLAAIEKLKSTQDLGDFPVILVTGTKR